MSGYHDRHPGDAEADAAVAAMLDQDGFHRGDILLFCDASRGFEHATVARVLSVLPGQQLCIEAIVDGCELVIDESDVVANGVA